MDLDSVADELYALSPDEFVDARNTAAKHAKDPLLAKAIKALRRPTASAHAVNQIVRANTDAIEALCALGDQLRAAMTGQGGDVRRLSEERREAISQLVSAEVPAGVRDDVTATLEAATADPQLAAAVGSGRLVKALRYAGFGEFPDLDDVVATPLRTTKQPAKKAAAKKPAAKKKPATRPSMPSPDLVSLRERVLELSGIADDAQRRYDLATRAAVEARAAMDTAEKERADAHRAARAAHAEAEKARRELGRLERS
ncbi:MAG TPA: hypothetical protein VFH54_17110 [Mycobacteriales bacterium]|nr:hypothetical protein [Mycobacteriales bacterium]